jgi:hypothetical protein
MPLCRLVGADASGQRLSALSYDVPFKFTGKINKLTFKLEPEQDAKR